MFGHGPMFPTLLDAFTLINLDITSSMNPWDFQVMSHHKIISPHKYDIGSLKDYLGDHNKIKGPVNDREHTTCGWSISSSVPPLLAHVPICSVSLRDYWEVTQRP
jgi:hypothetical protein